MARSKAVKVENIRGITEVGSYPEMCGLLEEDVKTGGARQKQLENWLRFFEYKHDKYKKPFYDIKVRETVIMNQVHGNATLFKHIRPQVVWNLFSKKGLTDSRTKTGWYYNWGLINNFYVESKRRDTLNNIDGIHKEVIRYFHSELGDKLRETFYSALDSMENDDLIAHYPEWMIFENGNTGVASQAEIEKILKVKSIVLKKMGLSAEPTGINAQEYYDNITVKVQEMYGWEYIYEATTIKFNKLYMPKDEPSDIEEDKIKLNNVFVGTLKKQVENYCIKQSERKEESNIEINSRPSFGRKVALENINQLDIPGLVISPEEYKELFDRLIDVFVKI